MKKKSHGQFYAVKSPSGVLMNQTLSRTFEWAFEKYLGSQGNAAVFGSHDAMKNQGYSIVKVTITEHLNEGEEN